MKKCDGLLQMPLQNGTHHFPRVHICPQNAHRNQPQYQHLNHNHASDDPADVPFAVKAEKAPATAEDFEAARERLARLGEVAAEEMQIARLGEVATDEGQDEGLAEERGRRRGLR